MMENKSYITEGKGQERRFYSNGEGSSIVLVSLAQTNAFYPKPKTFCTKGI